ncbi:sideroflexin-4 [Eucyclogobius newberryi]|uniref:sideroflexin-4 n=1 Tax=Eucyclogobius newberryi TaxID=166745 RepID=UPI003B5C6555
MDANLLHWKSQGQSFLGRLKIWFDLLDPTLLISSDAEIHKAHTALGSGEKTSEKETTTAATLALSSVHADTGQVLPFIFRPPALFPISAPIIYAAFLPHKSVKSALLSQFLLQSYFTGFNYANRNISSEKQNKLSLKQMFLNVGTVSYATCAGAFPQIIINRLRVRDASVLHFCRTVLPIPLAAFLAFFSLITVRSEEAEDGITVFDSEGNAVGRSKAAGEKAVRETALSRAALIGTTAAGPSLIVSLLQRSSFFRSRRLLLAPLRPFSLVFLVGLAIPASLSLFPQLGTVKQEVLEEELRAAAALDGHLYYHRGL